MLTPQDIETKEFAKAVFGGYDMTAVDDFLEELMADYSSLYKDNAILKGKIKVLVEKVEEYRSTEDAMRMALLTAQKMSDDMMNETKKKCDEMLSNASGSAEEMRGNIAKELTDEQSKLNAAKAKTNEFVTASRELVERYNEFLGKLDEVTEKYGGASEKAAAEREEPVYSPEPERAVKTEAAEETIKEIDQFVAEAMGKKNDDVLEDATKRIDVDAVREAADAAKEDLDATRKIEWNDEDELTTPRPKFNFTDLKFGTNYSDND